MDRCTIAFRDHIDIRRGVVQSLELGDRPSFRKVGCSLIHDHQRRVVRVNLENSVSVFGSNGDRHGNDVRVEIGRIELTSKAYRISASFEHEFGVTVDEGSLNSSNAYLEPILCNVCSAVVGADRDKNERSWESTVAVIRQRHASRLVEGEVWDGTELVRCSKT